MSTINLPNPLPFSAALGPALDRLPANVRRHFSQEQGTVRYRGVMRRIWRRPGLRGWLAVPFLWLTSRSDLLFPETGRDVPFVLECSVSQLPDGRRSMTLWRTFYFRNAVRRFGGLLTYDSSRQVILDRLGRRKSLEVELHARIDNNAIFLHSGRQWLRCGKIRLPLPAWIAGAARVREWQREDGSLGIRMTIANPLLGEFFGYDGTFSPQLKQTDAQHAPPASINHPSRHRAAPVSAVAHGIVAVAGTLAYAASFRAVAAFSSQAARLAMAAALAWLVLGVLLLAMRPAWVAARQSMQICLRTMTVGISFLSVATAINLASIPLGLPARQFRAFLPAHVAILVLANLAMGIYFVRRTRALPLSRTQALLLWLLGLDGSFAAILLFLSRIGGVQ